MVDYNDGIISLGRVPFLEFLNRPDENRDVYVDDSRLHTGDLG